MTLESYKFILIYTTIRPYMQYNYLSICSWKLPPKYK